MHERNAQKVLKVIVVLSLSHSLAFAMGVMAIYAWAMYFLE